MSESGTVARRKRTVTPKPPIESVWSVAMRSQPFAAGQAAAVPNAALSATKEYGGAFCASHAAPYSSPASAASNARAACSSFAVERVSCTSTRVPRTARMVIRKSRIRVIPSAAPPRSLRPAPPRSLRSIEVIAYPHALRELLLGGGIRRKLAAQGDVHLPHHDVAASGQGHGLFGHREGERGNHVDLSVGDGFPGVPGRGAARRIAGGHGLDHVVAQAKAEAVRRADGAVAVAVVAERDAAGRRSVDRGERIAVRRA